MDHPVGRRGGWIDRVDVQGPVSSLPAIEEQPSPRSGESTRRILLATDLSGASEAATAEALELARSLGAQLLIVSVIDTGTGPSLEPRVLRLDQRRTAREAEARGPVMRGRRVGVRVTVLAGGGAPGRASRAAAE